MSYKTIYHGSEKILKKPTFHYERSNKHNDYGLGFYCTQNLDMAKEWANRNSRSGFANKYSIDERGLKILDLTDKTKFSVLNWIAILLHVIGYRADDAYFRFPLMFVRNLLTFEKLEEIYMLGNLGKQYVLISQRAFERLEFIEALPSEEMFYERYRRRKDGADNSYRELERLERANKGKRIRDLLKEDND